MADVYLRQFLFAVGCFAENSALQGIFVAVIGDLGSQLGLYPALAAWLYKHPIYQGASALART